MEIIAEFVNNDGTPAGSQISLQVNTTTTQMNELVNQLLQNEEPTNYTFYINEEQIVGNLETTVKKVSSEKVIKIVYRPEAAFGVRAVSFCSAVLPGHSHTILCIAFSNTGMDLATGGGDGSVIFWDVNTQSMRQKLPIQTNVWIQCIQWHQTSDLLAIAGTDGNVRIIERSTQNEFSVKRTIKVASTPVFALEWQPYHLQNPENPYIAAATKGGDVVVFEALTGIKVFATSGHSNITMCLAWGADNVIYSASHDKTVKAWNGSNGYEIARYQPRRAGAWRTLAVSTAFVLRTGPYELGDIKGTNLKEEALKRLTAHRVNSPQEFVAAGNEDFTVSLLALKGGNLEEISRITGHTKSLNHIVFSPNGYWLATASFDHTVKIHDGKTGKFVCTLGKGRNKHTGTHVGPVYRVAWSADSRKLITASSDTTVKVWDLTRQKLLNDLPGHQDEVYALDWSPSGFPAASGGKDQIVRLWR